MKTGCTECRFTIDISVKPAVVTKTIRIKNTTVEIPFGSADVKALLTANYADKFDFALMSRNKVARRQIGTRCNSRF